MIRHDRGASLTAARLAGSLKRNPENKIYKKCANTRWQPPAIPRTG